MPAKQLLLRDRDKKFRLLFEENPQPMLVLDEAGSRILEANRAACDLYGYTPEEFRKKRVADLQGPEDAGRFAAETRAAARATGTWRHRTHNGRMIDVEIARHEIDYGGGKAQLAVLMDITGRRQLEEQLRQAQKMEAVGMLAGGVAHDFNNLLTIITGYSQLVLSHLAPDDPHRHSLEQIMKAGERAAGLTKQLLAFSRRQVLQPKVLDLNTLVTGLGAMLQRLIGEDIELRKDLAADLGSVNADPGQMEQVLMNLVVNSRDAMPKGGVLTIETANVELDEHYASRHIAVKPGPHILLAVSDTGSGMDAATQARLFEPFFTTKSAGQGTGLGLSTVFGIIKQSGGSLDVYSEPSHGTTIKVYLPRIDHPVSVEAEAAKKTVARGTETVLVVEDDEMVRTLVRETLEREGYNTIDAPGPMEAKRVSEGHKGAIHLLITDVVMPKLNGRDLAEQLMKRRPEMKVLYMSGYTDNAVVATGILEQKNLFFLQKPFTPAALIEKVREVLESCGDRMLHA